MAHGVEAQAPERPACGEAERDGIPRRHTRRMPRRTRIPPTLHGTSFHVSERDFHELSPGELRSSALDAPYHGVRSVGLRFDDAFDRVRMYAPRLRSDQLFCGPTAAQLLGIPLPLELERSTVIHVATVGGTRPRTRGVIGHVVRSATPYAVGEVLVTSPAETWCQIAAALSREDLVAAGDYLISGRRLPGNRRTPPLNTRQELAVAGERFGRQPGAVAIRWALLRIRTGVDSPRESQLRLVILAARLPEPVIGYAATVAGGLSLHPDLSYPKAKIAIEYEGDGHRQSKRRWRSDLRRITLLEDAGWRVIRVTDDDLRDPTVFIGVLHRALRERLT